MAIYNPSINLHALSGPTADIPAPQSMASTASASGSADAESNGAGEASIHSPLTPASSTGALDTDSMASSTMESKVTAEVKKLWRAAHKKCVAHDLERTGFVDRVTFLDSLRDIVGKILSAEEIVALTERYSHSGGEVDYHMCFRSCLNDALNKSSSSSTLSKFSLAPMSKSRPIGSMHPWEFTYSMRDNPYWKRACDKPRPLTVASSLDSGSVGFGVKTSLTSKPMKEYEAKVIVICKRFSLFSRFNDFVGELGQAKINNHKGCITTNNFMGIVDHFEIPASKIEMGTLLRVFRVNGMMDVINFREFVDLCLASRHAGEL